MDKAEKKMLAKNVLLIFLGCIVYSAGVALFLDANELASGGVTGIAIIVDYATGGVVGTGWLILIINVPLFIVGGVFFGKKFLFSSLASTAVSSGMIELWSYFVTPKMPIIQNTLYPALVGGAMFGAGLGMIFRAGSSTGGTDIIVKILHRKFRHLRTGIISLGVDVAIVAVSGIVYKDLELLITTVLSIIAFTVMFDRVLYGGNSAILVHIITTPEKAKPICDGLLLDLDVGATILDGMGAYTGDNKTVILCAVKNIVYPHLRDVVKKYDKDAFTIVSSAKEIYGEGYKSHDDEEL